jgi:hypothetical protein
LKELEALERLNCGAPNDWPEVAERKLCEADAPRAPDLRAPRLTIGIVITDNDVTTRKTVFSGQFMVGLLLEKG